MFVDVETKHFNNNLTQNKIIWLSPGLYIQSCVYIIYIYIYISVYTLYDINLM